MARRKVNIGSALVVEYAAANFGRFPTSVPGATGGEFSRVWASKNPEEYNVSPWGGRTMDTVDGCVEFAPITDAAGTPETAPDKTDIATTDQTQAANIMYVNVTNTGYAKVKQLSNPDAMIVRGFILGIYDRVGQPWFHVATNK
jgi:hypothetical protein